MDLTISMFATTHDYHMAVQRQDAQRYKALRWLSMLSVERQTELSIIMDNGIFVEDITNEAFDTAVDFLVTEYLKESHDDN